MGQVAGGHRGVWATFVMIAVALTRPAAWAPSFFRQSPSAWLPGILLFGVGVSLGLWGLTAKGALMAAAVLGSVPVAVVYSFFVDNYVSRLTAGAVKG